MPRHYLVDGYNVILQDPELDDLLDQEGLSAARAALRGEAERYARQSDCRIRLIYDGAVDTMSHDDRYTSAWVEDSFTSRDEKADERLVALALEYRRKGLPVTIVSDDREGIRVPLESAGFTLLTSAAFARLLRSLADSGLPREKSLPGRDQDELARLFLARDAEMRAKAAAERAAAPPVPPSVPTPPAPAPVSAPAPRAAGPTPASPSVPRRPGAAEQAAAARQAAIEAARAAKKERGARKQAKRLEQQKTPKR